MKREELDTRVKAAFQYGLDTLIEYLELRHGEAKEFRSEKKPITIGTYGTHRWVDPPEKVTYIGALKGTLEEFVRDESTPALGRLINSIIAEYYVSSRARSPIKGKIKDPAVSE